MAPGSTSKLPPELCGSPAAGCGSLPVSRAARLAAGTVTPSTTICGTMMAPSGMMMRVPSSRTRTRSRPDAVRFSSDAPSGRTTTPFSSGVSTISPRALRWAGARSTRGVSPVSWLSCAPVNSPFCSKLSIVSVLPAAGRRSEFPPYDAEVAGNDTGCESPGYHPPRIVRARSGHVPVQQFPRPDL